MLFSRAELVGRGPVDDAAPKGHVVVGGRWRLELHALLAFVAFRLVEVEVREGKVSEARNREVSAMVEESEDEGRLING